MGHSCPELWYDLRLGWKVADFTIAYHSEFFQVPQVELLATQPRLAPDGEFSFESGPCRLRYFATRCTPSQAESHQEPHDNEETLGLL